MRALVAFIFILSSIISYGQKSHQEIAEDSKYIYFQKDKSENSVYKFDTWYLIDEKTKILYKYSNCVSTTHKIIELKITGDVLFIRLEDKRTFSFGSKDVTVSYIKDGEQSYQRDIEKKTKEEFLADCGATPTKEELDESLRRSGYEFSRTNAMQFYNSQKYDDALRELNLLFIMHDDYAKKDIEVITALATVQYMKKSYTDAISTLTKGISNNANVLSFYLFRSTTYLNAGDPEKAIADAKKCIELQENDIQAHNQLVYCYMQSGKYEEALSASKVAKYKTQDNTIVALLYQNDYIAYSNLNQFDEAHEAIMLANQSNPNDVKIYADCAYSLWKNKKDLAGAKTAYGNLVKAYPENAEVLYQAAEVYHDAGAKEEGCEILMKAFKLKSPNAEQVVLRNKLCR